MLSKRSNDSRMEFRGEGVSACVIKESMEKRNKREKRRGKGKIEDHDE
jgi:hypothetical protein